MKILSRKILLLFSLFAIKLIIAQTKFENGYFAGYSAGYCQDVVNCIPLTLHYHLIHSKMKILILIKMATTGVFLML
jgi:hypothetical protein